MPRLSELWAVLDPLVGQVFEQPDGSNHAPPITTWYYDWSDYWCAMTVSYGLAHGGWSDDGGETLNMSRLVPGLVQTTPKGWSWVPSIEATFAALGLFDQTPREGDIFVTPGQTHTGFVREVLADGTVLTREGNYDNRFAEVRRRAADLRGFCHPPYDLQEEDMTPDEHKTLYEAKDIAEEARRAAVVARDISQATNDEVARMAAKLDALIAGKTS